MLEEEKRKVDSYIKLMRAKIELLKKMYLMDGAVEPVN